MAQAACPSASRTSPTWLLLLQPLRQLLLPQRPHKHLPLLLRLLQRLWLWLLPASPKPPGDPGYGLRGLLMEAEAAAAAAEAAAALSWAAFTSARARESSLSTSSMRSRYEPHSDSRVEM